ncbi:MAG: tetratricopeptide repeat protein [Cloacibacillus sp.]
MSNDDKEIKTIDETTDNNVGEIKCPETVPHDQQGMTDEEREWSAKTPPRRKVPRCVFIGIAIALLAAFGGGGWWYYRVNVLPEKYYLRAEALFNQKEYAKAEELYKKIMRIRPERRDILFKIGNCREERGDRRAAISYYEEHLKTAKNDVKAMTRVGWLYMENGEYEKALKWLKEAAKRRNKDAEIWNLTAQAAEKAGDIPEAAHALSRLSQIYKEPEKKMASGKELLRIGAYKEAIDAFSLAAKLAPDDKAPLHAIHAAKVMLGAPTNPRLVIVPGKSLGSVLLDSTKDEVKAAMESRGPDRKEFGHVGGKSIIAENPVEIWSYNINDPSREFKIIFMNGKVFEIETASPSFKTENGLGLSNFLMAKNSDKLKWRKEARNSAILCLAKEGGLTFYAADVTPDGAEARYKRLRVHHGDVGIDNIDGFSLLNLFDDNR